MAFLASYLHRQLSGQNKFIKPQVKVRVCVCVSRALTPRVLHCISVTWVRVFVKMFVNVCVWGGGEGARARACVPACPPSPSHTHTHPFEDAFMVFWWS